MIYNREKREWNVLNENFSSQMEAWNKIKESGNVLNEEYVFPELPSQEDLDLSTFVTRLKTLLKFIENKVDGLLKKENKTYDNFYYPYDEIINKLGIFFFPLSHLSSVNNNKEIREVYSECLPFLSEFYSKISQNEDLYESFVEIKKDEKDILRLKVIDDSLIGFKLSGIGQDDITKKRISEINSELSNLTDKYSNNVLDSISSYEKIIDEKDMEGIPEDLKDRAKIDNNKYKITLHIPSYSIYMDYGKNEKIREELYKAYTTKALNNESIIEEILSLKHEKSILLGYENYSELSLVTKMVDSSEDVKKFLEGLGDKSKVMGDLELKELEDFSKIKLKPHDISYYTTKLLKENYNFDEEEYKPYFELSNTVDGMFKVLYKMFGLVFKKVEDTKIWDPRVTVYDVYKNDMKMSRVYMDLENREGKRAGAWMNNWTSRYVDINNKVNLPIAFIVGNFTPATSKNPSLLTPNEVTTLFHEMGHVLQHICYEGDESSVSGINGVEWDAVEWSSQFLESFVYNKEVLKMISKHYKTGEILPDEMIEKMIENKNFHAAWNLLGQVVYSLFDMTIHSDKEAMDSKKVQKTLDDIRSKYSLLKNPDYNKFQCSFSHIFAGGYAAGYYSYKWAEVLSSDCYMRFIKDGIFNKETCDNYYSSFLSKGSEKPSMEMFKDFMEREPNENSLLEYLGIK